MENPSVEWMSCEPSQISWQAAEANAKWYRIHCAYPSQRGNALQNSYKMTAMDMFRDAPSYSRERSQRWNRGLWKKGSVSMKMMKLLNTCRQ